MSKETQKKKAEKLKELRRIHGQDYGKVACENCHGMFEPKVLVVAPDPFDSEFGGDNTPVTLCKECYDDSCADI